MPLLTVEDSFDFHLPILSMVRGPGQQQNCHGEKKKKGKLSVPYHYQTVPSPLQPLCVHYYGEYRILH